MNINTKFNLEERVLSMIFPHKFEYCLIIGIYIYDRGTFYQMDNGLLIKEDHIFNNREEAVKWAEELAEDPNGHVIL